MGSQNWKPRVGLVSLTLQYYVDLDDEEMVENAKECCLQDAMKVELGDDYRVQIENRDLCFRYEIIEPFLEAQTERLLDQSKCPFCKGTVRRINDTEVRCGHCDENWDWIEPE